MKYALVLLALFALSVQGHPSQKALPEGLESFQPRDVLAYVQKLAARQLMQSRMISQVSDGQKLNSNQCFQRSSAALTETAEKSEQGNTRCENILTDAQAVADAKREADRKAIDASSTNIQSNLNSCNSENIESPEKALECYETQGQRNVNPVSSLSSAARDAQRNFRNTVAVATTDSQGCSFDVSTESEAVSAEIFNNLNTCMATGVWNDVVVPDFGPVPPTTVRPETGN